MQCTNVPQSPNPTKSLPANPSPLPPPNLGNNTHRPKLFSLPLPHPIPLRKILQIFIEFTKQLFPKAVHEGRHPVSNLAHRHVDALAGPCVADTYPIFAGVAPKDGEGEVGAGNCVEARAMENRGDHGGGVGIH
jgi:hypothetical protein